MKAGSPARLRSSKTRVGGGGRVQDIPQPPQKEVAGFRLLHDVDDGAMEAITLGMDELMDAEEDEEDVDSEPGIWETIKDDFFGGMGDDEEEDDPPEDNDPE